MTPVHVRGTCEPSVSLLWTRMLPLWKFHLFSLSDLCGHGDCEGVVWLVWKIWRGPRIESSCRHPSCSKLGRRIHFNSLNRLQSRNSQRARTCVAFTTYILRAPYGVLYSVYSKSKITFRRPNVLAIKAHSPATLLAAFCLNIMGRSIWVSKGGRRVLQPLISREQLSILDPPTPYARYIRILAGP